MTQSIHFAFTLNNYQTTDWPEELVAACDFGIMGEEEGAEGTPHLQGFLRFKKRCTINGIRKKNYWHGLHPHLELCRGTFKQNLAYVSKDGITHEFGERPSEATEDIPSDPYAYMRDLALATTPIDHAALAALLPSHAILHGRHLEDFKDRVHAHAGPRAVLRNYWLYGKTGVGKSVRAKTYGEYYIYNPEEKWFPPPFNYQDVLIIDEVTPRSISFRVLSRFGDHDAFTPEKKHGYWSQYRPSIVVVTSNYRISECFDAKDVPAIQRRFEEIEMV